MEQQQQPEGPRYWWEADTFPEFPDYDPANDPWATPAAASTAQDAQTPKPTHCGRCDSDEGPEGLMHHLEWKCEAQEAWIEAAINDRQARPDRYKQAKKDLGARTLTEARAALAARKAN